ncbi:MAG: hypothetical protein GF417_02145 [Candidatus Latescibacteria bacterium]|nr:hypothetical protein [bacterium]MBD3423230.1 hypothetical protein [Candidatus Latescibacterota bacterium]
MTEMKDTRERIRELAEIEGIYDEKAYMFVMIAVERVIKSLSGPPRHISGSELLEGIVEYAREEFGPMAKEVFNFWGVEKSVDFGRIVFSLVEAGMLEKTEKDSLEDFRQKLDFEKIFEDGYFE